MQVFGVQMLGGFTFAFTAAQCWLLCRLGCRLGYTNWMIIVQWVVCHELAELLRRQWWCRCWCRWSWSWWSWSWWSLSWGLHEIGACNGMHVACWWYRFIKHHIACCEHFAVREQDAESFEVRLSIPNELANICLRRQRALVVRLVWQLVPAGATEKPNVGDVQFRTLHNLPWALAAHDACDVGQIRCMHERISPVGISQS